MVAEAGISRLTNLARVDFGGRTNEIGESGVIAQRAGGHEPERSGLSNESASRTLKVYSWSRY